MWRISIVRSPLVQAAGIAVRLTPWWLAYLLSFVGVIAAALLVSPVAPWFEGTSFPLAREVPVVLLHVVIGALLFAWIKYREERPVRSVGFTAPDDRRAVARGFGIGVGAFAVVVLVLMLLGAVHLTPTESGTVRFGALLPAVVMVPIWLLMAAVQEALSRGFLLQVTGLQLTAWAAIVGQAVLWAIVRAASAGTTDVMALVNLVLLGVALAFVALVRGSLWLVVGLQAGWSWFATSVIGMTSAGGPEPASILSLVPTAGSWLSGGANGIIAAGLLTLALAAAAAFAFRTFTRTTPDRKPDGRVNT